MNSFDIVISNPTSYIWLWMGVVMFAWILFGILFEATFQENHPKSDWKWSILALFIFLAILTFVVFMATGNLALNNERWDRVAAEISEEANFTHVEINSSGEPGRKFVAMDEDGMYVSGVIYENTPEDYTVVLEK